ncbi:MAG: gliding motility lipoprotein GldH [Prevotellaceae bacterium]|nr:gliding motility lipoprotein GldH [Prevotellaceae bacterium]MDY2634248.1 gliding motility lipoprotein GldH [Prevotella sp.]
MSKLNQFMRPSIAALMTIVMGGLMVSCLDDKIYDHYFPTDIDGWDKSHELTFDIPPIEKSGVYKEQIGVRYSKLYPFMTLNIIVEQTVYPDAKVWIDTLNCEMMNKRGGLLGKGLNLSQIQVPLRQIHIQQGDSIHFRIRHNMRRDILPGISDLGLTITLQK